MCSDYGMGPAIGSPTAGTTISPGDADFSWTGAVGCGTVAAGDQWDLAFYNPTTYAKILTINGLGTTSTTLTPAQLQTLISGGDNHEVIWAAQGRSTATPATGAYLGENATIFVNQPPVADAGTDVTAECSGPGGTEVALDGTGSSDPDGDALTYSWTPAFLFDDPTSPTPTGTFSTGVVTVTLTVSDGLEEDVDDVDVTIEDTLSPTLTCPSNITIQCSGFCGTPADDPQLANFFATFDATDICDDNLDTVLDYRECFEVGITQVTFTATDASGNASACGATVTVEDTTPPTVACPPDITVECSGFCGTPADDPQLTEFLDTFEATDVCDDDLSIMLDYPECFEVGDTEVLYAAIDASGNQAACTSMVTVEDTTPPEITLSLSRDVLWPPNHKMADIVATVTATDICDSDPEVILVDVESSEPDNNGGDGDTDDDIQGADQGTEDYEFQLRAERSGKRGGRIYTITYRATDDSGNYAEAVAYVRVPHDQSGMAFAATGFNDEGTGLVSGQEEFVLVIPSRTDVFGIGHNGKMMLIETLFDATELDMSRTYVGNTKGISVPTRWEELDQDGDGLTDVAVWYQAASVEPLVAEVVQRDLGDQWVSDPIDPVGLHYMSANGIDYLVSDIFQIGAPVELSGSGSAAVDEPPVVPAETKLFPVAPNPFTGMTSVRFSLAAEEHVVLRIYDTRGGLVNTLEDRVLAAGRHHMTWSGRTTNGGQVAAGVYFVRLDAGPYRMTRKMVLSE
jgi:hypothetical protein